MTPLSTVAAVILLRADGSALLQHRDNLPEINRPDMWVPPGGHCEPGESEEACARREFFEETDYRLGDLQFLVSFVDDDATLRHAVRVTVFWSEYDGVQQPVCREGQALRFVARETAQALKVPAYLIDLWDAADAARTGTA